MQGLDNREGFDSRYSLDCRLEHRFDNDGGFSRFRDDITGAPD